MPAEDADIRIALERMTHLAERVSALADEFRRLVERMPTSYVSREVYERDRKTEEMLRLGIEGDHAKLAAEAGAFMGEYRRDREADRKERRVLLVGVGGLVIALLGIFVTLYLGLR